MLFPISRVVTMLMFAGICFAVLLPLAVQRHSAFLAALIVGVFVAYLVANVVLWRRLRPHR